MHRSFWLLALALSYHSSASALVDTFEGFDFRNCKHWNLSTDPHEYGDLYQLARDEANRRNVISNFDDALQQWIVLEYWDERESDMHVDKRQHGFGICRRVVEWKGIKLHKRFLICAQTAGFPLSGATYKAIDGHIPFPTYKCYKGCNSQTLETIHDIGYEAEQPPKRWKIEKRKFDRQCK